jgi:uncharacterized protein with HEPN domain
MTKESFLQDSKIQDAVIRQFEIIGEATKRVSATTRDAKPEIPWRDMAGMRDKLIHDYIGTDVFRVWGIVSERVPEVLPLVHQLLDELDINSP